MGGVAARLLRGDGLPVHLLVDARGERAAGARRACCGSACQAGGEQHRVRGGGLVHDGNGVDAGLSTYVSGLAVHPNWPRRELLAVLVPWPRSATAHGSPGSWVRGPCVGGLPWLLRVEYVPSERERPMRVLAA